MSTARLLGMIAAGVALAGLDAGRAAVPWRPQSLPAVSIAGKAYVPAAAFARRFGLTMQPARTADARTLSSRWTRIELAANTQEIQVNDLNVFLSDPVAADRGRLLVSRRDVGLLLRPILAPRTGPLPPAVRTIVVDPGHGGRDPGNENRRLGLQEKTFTLQVGRRVATLLKASGFHVVLTRNRDRTVPLEARVALARRVHADLFVSVHFNSIRDPQISGAETYVLTPRLAPSAPTVEHDARMRTVDYPGNAFDSWNAVLGYKVHLNLVEATGAVDRGLKRYRYYVLRMSPCPAVLVEPAFLSNRADARRVQTAAYRARIAQGITAGVKAYAATVRRARAARFGNG